MITKEHKPRDPISFDTLTRIVTWCLMISTLFALPGNTAEQAIDIHGAGPALQLPSCHTRAEQYGEGSVIVDFGGDYNDVHDYVCATDGYLAVHRYQDSVMIATSLFDVEYQWQFTADGPLNCRPLIADGMVFFGCDDGYYYCLDERTGKELWRYDARREATVIEEIEEETKKSGGLFGGLKNLKDAVKKVKKITKKEKKPNDLRCTPAIIGNTLCCYVPAAKLIALAVTDGTLLWEAELVQGREEGEPWSMGFLPNELYGWPLSRIDTLNRRFAVLYGCALAYDPFTGEKTILNRRDATVSTGDTKGQIPFISAAVSGSNVVAMTVDSALAMFDGNGQGVMWQSPAAGAQPATEIFADDGIVVTLDPGPTDLNDGETVHAYDAATGEFLWAVDSLTGDRVWFGDESVYIIHNRNHINAYNRQSGELSWGIDLSNLQVECLYDARGSLLFGTDQQSNILVLNGQERAYRKLIADAAAATGGSPAHTIKRLLAAGYPHKVIADDTLGPALLSPEALAILRKQRLSDTPKVAFDCWRLQSQEIDGSFAKVSLVAVPQDGGTWRLDTLDFVLGQRESIWRVIPPLPPPCVVSTSEGRFLFRDTPGLKWMYSDGSYPLAPGDTAPASVTAKGPETSEKGDAGGRLAVEKAVADKVAEPENKDTSGKSPEILLSPAQGFDDLSTEEILNRHLEALGGMDALNAIRTLDIWQLEEPGGPKSRIHVIISLKDGAFRREYYRYDYEANRFPDTPFAVHIFDGESALTRDFRGSEDMGPDKLRMLQEENRMLPVLDVVSRDLPVHYEGAVVIDAEQGKRSLSSWSNHPAYCISVDDPNGRYRLYFDPQTFHLLRKQSAPYQYRDYLLQERFGDVVMYTKTFDYSGPVTRTIESVSINDRIEPGLFQQP